MNGNPYNIIATENVDSDGNAKPSKAWKIRLAEKGSPSGVFQLIFENNLVLFFSYSSPVSDIMFNQLNKVLKDIPGFQPLFRTGGQHNRMGYRIDPNVINDDREQSVAMVMAIKYMLETYHNTGTYLMTI